MCCIYLDDIYSKRVVTDVDEGTAAAVAAAVEYDDEGDGYEVNRRSSSSGVTKGILFPSATSSASNNGSGDSKNGKRSVSRLRDSPSGSDKKRRPHSPSSGNERRKRQQMSSLAMSQFSSFNASLIDLEKTSLESSSNSSSSIQTPADIELEMREKRARAEALELQNAEKKQMLEVQRAQIEFQQQNTAVILALLNQLNTNKTN